MDLDGTFSKVRASSRMFQKQGCGVTVMDLDGTFSKVRASSRMFQKQRCGVIVTDRDSTPGFKPELCEGG